MPCMPLITACITVNNSILLLVILAKRVLTPEGKNSVTFFIVVSELSRCLLCYYTEHNDFLTRTIPHISICMKNTKQIKQTFPIFRTESLNLSPMDILAQKILGCGGLFCTLQNAKSLWLASEDSLTTGLSILRGEEKEKNSFYSPCNCGDVKGLF